MNELTPKQIVEELDKYIIGQNDAKKMMAIALRSRYRRRRVISDIKDDIMPKNILMIGPTGVGKTEIARRLAKIVNAPFVKVEATKFTEVGYVGRDVESIIRDLIEQSIRLVKEEKLGKINLSAKELARERIVEILAPSTKKKTSIKNPFELFIGFQGEKTEDSSNYDDIPNKDELSLQREQIRKQIELGLLDDVEIEIEIEDNSSMPLGMIAGGNLDDLNINMQDVLGNIFPKKKKTKKTNIKEALRIFEQEEANKLIDMDEVNSEAIKRAEEDGIVFIDEFDKIAGRGGSNGPDVSREGVQRDILPIVEGSTVNTKYGQVRTDHMLFVAAGAFHVSKVSDLIPELQGRFPVRVELSSLMKDDFKEILIKPKNALTRQYIELLKTDGVAIEFAEDGIEAIAEIAYKMNLQRENIGARRLHTVLEQLLMDISYEAPDSGITKLVVDKGYVYEKVNGLFKEIDTDKYII